MIKQLRVGIVGVGNIGTAHAKAIGQGKIEGMRLCALCDTDEGRRAQLTEQYPDVAIFEQHQDLIRAGLCDAIVIATPHYFHSPIAIDAMRAGLHVLTEKPAGVEASSARRMCEVARQTDRTLAIMFNQRTNALFAKARELVADTSFGTLKRVVWIITNWYRKQAYYDSGDWRGTWAGEGGGVLLNQAPHNLDLWQWICGVPQAVRANCYVAKHHNMEVEDDVTIFAEYACGATGVFITSTGDFPGTNRLEITGSGGKLVLEGGKLTHYKLKVDERTFCQMPEDEQNVVEKVVYEDVPCQGHEAVLRNFAAAILHGEPLIATGEDGLRELQLSNAAYLSAWTGQAVQLPCDEEAFGQMLRSRVMASVSTEKRGGAKDAHDGNYFARWNTNW